MPTAVVDSERERFRTEVIERIEQHPIVRHNAYCEWFSHGRATLDELRRFTVQFSVFSHLFLEAQLRKCIEAPDLASYRASKAILLNELGVGFHRDGSIDNGVFRFRAAHFEWLLDFAEALGLAFDEIGKRRFGWPSTLAFCDALKEWYGSPDPSTAAGASHAIEHWAAAGFWKQIIAGLRRIKAERIPALPLGFWTWHDRIEDLHAAHTDGELDLLFGRPDFSEERFLRGGVAVLDAVAEFWNGLEADRRARQVPG
jgi:hypothetical protein